MSVSSIEFRESCQIKEFLSHHFAVVDRVCLIILMSTEFSWDPWQHWTTHGRSLTFPSDTSAFQRHTTFTEGRGEVLLLFILMSLVVRIKSLVGCEKCVQKLSRNHFCRIYLSREVSAMLCCTCMPKYLKIIFHYSGSEMEYKCDSNNSRGSGESLFETLDLIKEYFNEISGGRIENAEHKNKKQILRRCGHWPVETCHDRADSGHQGRSSYSVVTVIDCCPSIFLENPWILISF